MLLGGISEGKDRLSQYTPTLTNSLQRSRISSLSHQVFVTWVKPSEILRHTKSVVLIVSNECPSLVGTRRQTLFLSPQIIDQREHAAHIGESSFRQSDAVEDQPDAVVQAKDRVGFSSLGGNLGHNIRGVEHPICSKR